MGIPQPRLEPSPSANLENLEQLHSVQEAVHYCDAQRNNYLSFIINDLRKHTKTIVK
jgi:hypothetical protein